VRCYLPCTCSLQVDVFTVRSRYLGNLENVTIWHDGSKNHPDWFLENIRINETFSGMEQTFTCSCWIYKNDPKTLYPQVISPFPVNTEWNLVFNFLSQDHVFPPKSSTFMNEVNLENEWICINSHYLFGKFIYRFTPTITTSSLWIQRCWKKEKGGTKGLKKGVRRGEWKTERANGRADLWDA